MRHEEFYSNVYEIVKGSFLELETQKRESELKTLIHSLIAATSLEIISHLWAVEIFKYLSTKQSGYIFSAECIVVTAAAKKIFTMLELIDNIYRNLQTKLELLYVLGLIKGTVTCDLLLKKHLHIVVHRLELRCPQVISILTKKMSDIVPTENFLKTKLKNAGEFLEKKESFIKLTLFVLYLEFEEN